MLHHLVNSRAKTFNRVITERRILQLKILREFKRIQAKSFITNILSVGNRSDSMAIKTMTNGEERSSYP